MLGVRGQSAIATLVERQTRYVMLLAVGRDKTSHHVCALIACNPLVPRGTDLSVHSQRHLNRVLYVTASGIMTVGRRLFWGLRV